MKPLAHPKDQQLPPAPGGRTLALRPRCQNAPRPSVQPTQRKSAAVPRGDFWSFSSAQLSDAYEMHSDGGFAMQLVKSRKTDRSHAPLVFWFITGLQVEPGTCYSNGVASNKLTCFHRH